MEARQEMPSALRAFSLEGNAMTRRRSAIELFVGVAVLAAGAIGCDKPVTPVAPTVPGPPPVASDPRLTGFDVTGNRPLSAIGETVQLAAMARYSDSTTKDISSETQWSSQFAEIATVSPGGLVTATGLGASIITAVFTSGAVIRRTVVTVVSPPGTFFVAGRVREPGSGSITDVKVVEATSGRSMMTGTDGEYSIGGLTSARLAFEKPGYEPSVIDATPNGSNDVAMQRVLRVPAGESVAPTLVPDDMDYAMDAAHCHPCRLIRVVNPKAGLLRLRVTWTEPHSVLDVWAAGKRFERTGTAFEVATDVRVDAGELLVYVGARSSTYCVTFGLSTVLE
jgi:Big-like domain-containing protein